MDDKINLLLDMATKNEQRMDNLTNIMNQNTEKISHINARINEFESALSFTSTTAEENKQKTSNLETVVAAQAATIEQLSLKINKLEVKLKCEADKRDRSENVGRRQNLEISGIPSCDPEPRSLLKQRVLELAQALGAKISLPDIEDAHRKRSGGVIVRMISRPARDELYKYADNPEFKPKLIALNSNSFPNWPTLERGKKIFLNESLTEDRSRLAKICRDKLNIINREEGRIGYQRLSVLIRR